MKRLQDREPEEDEPEVDKDEYVDVDEDEDEEDEDEEEEDEDEEDEDEDEDEEDDDEYDKDDEESVKNAVVKSWDAFAYASHRLQDDSRFVWDLMTTCDPCVLMYASKKVKQSVTMLFRCILQFDPVVVIEASLPDGWTDAMKSSQVKKLYEMIQRKFSLAFPCVSRQALTCVLGHTPNVYTEKVLIQTQNVLGIPGLSNEFSHAFYRDVLMYLGYGNRIHFALLTCKKRMEEAFL